MMHMQITNPLAEWGDGSVSAWWNGSFGVLSIGDVYASTKSLLNCTLKTAVPFKFKTNLLKGPHETNFCRDCKFHKLGSIVSSSNTLYNACNNPCRNCPNTRLAEYAARRPIPSSRAEAGLSRTDAQATLSTTQIKQATSYWSINTSELGFLIQELLPKLTVPLSARTNLSIQLPKHNLLESCFSEQAGIAITLSRQDDYRRRTEVA